MRLLVKSFLRFWIPIGVLCCLQATLAQRGNAQGSEFVLIPGGSLFRGRKVGNALYSGRVPLSTAGQNFGNAEGPAHPTWITEPFWIATKEVSVDEFKWFVDATGYVTTAERRLTEMVGWDPAPEDAPLYESHDFARSGSFTWKNPGYRQDDNHPVVGVTGSMPSILHAAKQTRRGEDPLTNRSGMGIGGGLTDQDARDLASNRDLETLQI